MVTIELTGLAVTADLIAAFAAIGSGRIAGDVMTLCVLGVVADGIAEYAFDAIAKGVLKEFYYKGESKESINGQR